MNICSRHALYLGVKTSILYGFLFLENGLKNVALHKQANQSNTWVDTGHPSKAWVAGRAVDDCLTRNPYTAPYCCSATVADTDNYWHLNLEDKYQVQRIVIYGRTDGKLV